MKWHDFSSLVVFVIAGGFVNEDPFMALYLVGFGLVLGFLPWDHLKSSYKRKTWFMRDMK